MRNGISTIVVNFNRTELARDGVGQLHEQMSKDDEIIFISFGKDDGTESLVGPNDRLYRLPRPFRYCWALNVGASLAERATTFFSLADMIYPPGFLDLVRSKRIFAPIGQWTRKDGSLFWCWMAGGMVSLPTHMAKYLKWNESASDTDTDVDHQFLETCENTGERIDRDCVPGLIHRYHKINGFSRREYTDLAITETLTKRQLNMTSEYFGHPEIMGRDVAYDRYFKKNGVGIELGSGEGDNIPILMYVARPQKFFAIDQVGHYFARGKRSALKCERHGEKAEFIEGAAEFVLDNIETADWVVCDTERCLRESRIHLDKIDRFSKPGFAFEFARCTKLPGLTTLFRQQALAEYVIRRPHMKVVAEIADPPGFIVQHQ